MKRGEVVGIILILVFAFIGAFLLSQQNLTGYASSDELSSGLTANYKFDGNPKDSSGNEYTGIEKNGPISYGVETGPTERASTTKQFIVLNGLNNYIQLKNNYSKLKVFPSDSWTFATWIKPGIQNAVKPTIFMGAWHKPTIVFLNNSNSIQLRFTNSSEKFLDCVTSKKNSIKLNEWNHVAITAENGNYRIYVNGNLSSTKTCGWISSKAVSSYVIGGTGGKNDTNYFKGGLDEMRIYERVLSDSEIRSLAGIESPSIEGNKTNKTQICTDSDGEKDYFTKGQVTDSLGVIEDICLSGKTLREVYCNGTEGKTEDYNCPNRCENGACINETIIEPVCGNGILEDGEECDDGNLIDNDDCSNNCAINPRTNASLVSFDKKLILEFEKADLKNAGVFDFGEEKTVRINPPIAMGNILGKLISIIYDSGGKASFNVYSTDSSKAVKIEDKFYEIPSQFEIYIKLVKNDSEEVKESSTLTLYSNTNKISETESVILTGEPIIVKMKNTDGSYKFNQEDLEKTLLIKNEGTSSNIYLDKIFIVDDPNFFPGFYGEQNDLDIDFYASVNAYEYFDETSKELVKNKELAFFTHPQDNSKLILYSTKTNLGYDPALNYDLVIDGKGQKDYATKKITDKGVAFILDTTNLNFKKDFPEYNSTFSLKSNYNLDTKTFGINGAVVIYDNGSVFDYGSYIEPSHDIRIVAFAGDINPYKNIVTGKAVMSGGPEIVFVLARAGMTLSGFIQNHYQCEKLIAKYNDKIYDASYEDDCTTKGKYIADYKIEYYAPATKRTDALATDLGYSRDAIEEMSEEEWYQTVGGACYRERKATVEREKTCIKGTTTPDTEITETHEWLSTYDETARVDKIVNNVVYILLGVQLHPDNIQSYTTDTRNRESCAPSMDLYDRSERIIDIKLDIKTEVVTPVYQPIPFEVSGKVAFFFTKLFGRNNLVIAITENKDISDSTCSVTSLTKDMKKTWNRRGGGEVVLFRSSKVEEITFSNTCYHYEEPPWVKPVGLEVMKTKVTFNFERKGSANLGDADKPTEKWDGWDSKTLRDLGYLNEELKVCKLEPHEVYGGDYSPATGFPSEISWIYP